MVNSRQKMQTTNKIILDFLRERGFTNIYVFPHMRHMKDYIVDGEGFDAIGWKTNSKTFPKKQCYLFQFKTNCPCPKKILEKYKEIHKNTNAVLCWVTRVNKRKLTKKHPDEIEVWTIGE